MDEFTRKVLNFIQKNGMLKDVSKVVAGFSGGADSTALLSVLDELKDVLGISLCAIHINHQIRKEAADDENFCRCFCLERGIPFKSVIIDVPLLAKEKSLTEEEAGRIARYEAFNSYAGQIGAEYIAVAHHQNDVAETLLMNLARGTGLRGGASIRPVRDNVIRPLLCVSRQEIEEYLGKRDISFCTDKTNLENIHTRNIIRNEILPLLTDKVNQRTVEHLSFAAVSFDKADEFIRGFTKELFQNLITCEKDRICVSVEELLAQKEVIRENLVLLMFEELVSNRKDISQVHVEAVLSLLTDTDGQAFVDLPYGLVAKRTYNRLEIGRVGNEKRLQSPIALRVQRDEETEIFVPGLGKVNLAVFPYVKGKEVPTQTYTKWLDYDRIQEVSFRNRREGDVISISQGDDIHQKSLSKFMTDEKIPRDQRDELVVVADGSRVLWVPGYRISASYKVNEGTNYILEIKIDDGGMING